jgi:GH24 family phage-related lysozyme (muramidase)
MPLAADIKTEVGKKLEEYEGKLNHLYLDSLGKVTVGIGHLIPNRSAIGPIPMFKTKNGVATQAASAQEKMDEYDKIAKLSKGYKASWYGKHTTLVMKEADIKNLLEKHIASFYKELTTIYQKTKGYPDDFDTLPKNVQIGLFDMIFNLGASKIVNVFQGFDTAVKAGDWAKAAQECNRPQLSSARNTYVKNLFLSAVKKTP